MLEWLQRTLADTAKRLKDVEVERARLQGGLAALEAAIAQATNEAKRAGGGNGAAPTGLGQAPKWQGIATMPESHDPPTQGVQEMVKVPHGPLQADQELRE